MNGFRHRIIVISLIFLLFLSIPNSGTNGINETDSLESTSTSPNGDDALASTDWLEGWDFRKSHMIEGTSGAGTNYQVNLTVHYGSGTDSGTDIYTDFKSQPDFDDIRFTDNDSVTLLDYWIEYNFDGENATFWVEVADNLDTDVSIYIYYGNSEASSLSNGTATFIFFDDYEDQDLDEWEITATGCVIDDTQSANGDYSMMLYATPGPQIKANFTFSGDPLTHDFMIHNWVRDDNQLRGGHAPLVVSIQEYSRWTMRGYESSFQHYEGSDYTGWPQNNAGGSDTWFEINLGVSYTTDEFLGWKDGLYMGSLDLNANNGNPIPDDIYGFIYSQQSGYRTWYDDTYVRKWIETEPNHGQWGSEEASYARWYHDCSNITAFNGYADDSWYSNPAIHIDGEIASSGSYIYPTDYGTGSDKHGPMQYHNFSSPILMSQLVSFQAELEIDTLVDAEYGSISVMLFDQYNNMSLQVGIGDSWSGENEITARAAYTFENQSTAVTTPTGLYTYSVAEPYRETLLVTQNSSGLFAFIPRIGNFTLLEHDQVEPNRVINSIAVHFRADVDLTQLNIARVHDIELTYRSGEESLIPSIDNPPDIEYEAGTFGHNITWITGNFTPTSFEIYRNETLLVSEEIENSEVNISIDGLNIGVYNYTATVFGDDDIVVSDSVLVTVVDTTAPVVSDPSDFEYEAGTTGNVINWTAIDLFEASYEVQLDGTQIETSDWTDFVVVSVDGHDPGTYNYRVVFTDESNNTGESTVTVTVVDTTAPTSSSPIDMQYVEDETGNTITWTGNDLYPATYQIRRNGTLIQSGDWNTTSESVILNIDSHSAGVYLFEITFTDESGNSYTDVVIVTVLPSIFSGLLGNISFIITIGSVAVIVIIGAVVCRSRGDSGGGEYSFG